MAIATIDEATAGALPPQEFVKAAGPGGVIGRYYTPNYVGGRPGAMAAPAPGVNGAALTTYAGQIPFTNGAAEQYLYRLAGTANLAGTLYLCDRLWHNSGLSVTSLSAQAITFPGLPARDSAGSTNGDGVMAAMEVVTATGAGLNVPQITYTDEAGNTGNVATPRVAYAASQAAGSFYDFALAAGDLGVRAITSFINTVSMTSGTISLVLYRVIARLGIPLANVEAAIDFVTSGTPKMYDNSVPFLLFLPTAATGPVIQGSFTQTNG